MVRCFKELWLLGEHGLGEQAEVLRIVGRCVGESTVAGTLKHRRVDLLLRLGTLGSFCF